MIVILYFSIKEFFIPSVKPIKPNTQLVSSSIFVQNIKTVDVKLEQKKLLEEKRKKELAIKKEAERKRKAEIDRKKEAERKRKAEIERKKKAERKRKVEEQTIYTDAIYDSVALNNPAPKYPILSKKEGEEGEVILLAKISKEGRVITVSIYQSSGYIRLDNASLHAVKSWYFIPAKNKFGGNLESVVKIPFVFKIRNTK